jgi:predicted nucleic acid-binding protein
MITSGARDGWATCPVTELGLIRVCAQLPVGRRTPEATADLLAILRVTSVGHVFWPDFLSPSGLAEVRAAATAKEVTDRYLWALARRFGGRVITFDRGLSAVAGDDAECLLTEQGPSH